MSCELTSERSLQRLLDRRRASIMNKTMFLLVATVALLVGPAALRSAPRTDENLNSVISLVETVNQTKYMDVFVEDLRESDCVDMFFCKAHNILRKHLHQREDGIVNNLKVFVEGKHLNCTVWKPEVGTITLYKFLEFLADCSRETNLTGGKES